MTSCAVLQVSCTWSEASLGALLSRLITSPLSKGHSEGFGLSACVKGGVSKSHMIQEVSTFMLALMCMPLQPLQQASSWVSPRWCSLACRLLEACRLSLAVCRTSGNS